MEKIFYDYSDLKSEELNTKMSSCIEAAKEISEKQSEILQSTFEIIKEHGAVNIDVFEYLCSHFFPDTGQLKACFPLFQKKADIEWYRLILEFIPLNKIQQEPIFWINVVIYCFSNNISADIAQKLCDAARTPYEYDRMCSEHVKKYSPESIKESLKNINQALFLMEEKKALCASNRLNEKENECNLNLQEKNNNELAFYKDMYLFTQEENKTLKLKLLHLKENNCISPCVEEKELAVITDPISTESQIVEEKDNIKLFDSLLKNHTKKKFLKLSAERQRGFIFSLMVANCYTKEKVLMIKDFLDVGMTDEFVYDLICNKDLTDEALSQMHEVLACKN